MARSCGAEVLQEERRVERGVELSAQVAAQKML